MPTTRLNGEFKGHQFQVINTWFGGLKFFHNDKLIEHNKNVLAIDKDTPLISKFIAIENTDRLVEIYVYAILRVKIQIKVDGIKIAGDDF